MSWTTESSQPKSSENQESKFPSDLYECQNEPTSSTSLNLPEDDTDPHLDLKPVPPLDSDCCGSGCKICVFDIYEKQLKEWQERHCKKLVFGQQSEGKNLLSESTFRKFVLKEISQETKATFRYHFHLPFSQSLNIQAGQHIILRTFVNGKAIYRQYTPINLIKSKGYFELLIKIYPDGVMSQYLQTWKPGIEVDFRGPFGQFSMQQISKFPRLVLLAAGTGIAPLSCIIESILDNEEDETFVHLVFACRRYEDILMREELHEWLDFWNFSALCCLSQENSASVGFCKESLHFGRINFDLLTRIKELQKTFFLICGPNSFNKNIVNFLLELEIHESQYFIF